ncbi:hypothetical protein ACWDA9_14585, partial [Streptomyces sp. NPDC001193]
EGVQHAPVDEEARHRREGRRTVGLLGHADRGPSGPPGPTINVGASIQSFSDQIIADTTLTKILFSSAVYDTSMMFDAPNSALVVRTAGRYQVTGRVLLTYTPNPAGARNLQLQVNGGGRALDSQDTAVLPGTGYVSQSVSATLELAVGDVITLHVLQTTGANASSRFVPGSLSTAVAPRLTAELLVPTP